MKKIYISKSDSVASIVEKIINVPEQTVVLYIPRFTNFASSRNNFILLRREARAAGKEIVIESIDDDVLELATTTEFKAVNPFFGKRRKAVSDIVSIKPGIQIPDIKIQEHKQESKLEDNNEGKEVFESETVIKEKNGGKIRALKSKVFIRREKSIKETDYSDVDKKVILKRFFIAIGITACITFVVTVILLALPRANIVLDFQKFEWDFVGSLNASTGIKENNFINDKIELRGISFHEKRNITEGFPATGSEFVEQKAKGTVIIYNAYSSEKQTLVKTTRLVTPDGKIFRTDSDITVPGAQIIDGKIVPSKTEVTVTADEPGDSYNIGSVSRFRIPGLQGSPKFDGFYGESTTPMSGGFVGEKKVPTETDINSARSAISATLENAVKSQLFLDLPKDIKIIDGTYKFSVINEAVNKDVGGDNKFAFTIVGESSVVGFKENELMEIIELEAEKGSGVDLAVSKYKIEYGELKIQEIEGSEGFSVPISIESTWTRPFDKAQFIKNAAGMNEAELKTFIFSVPGIAGSEVRFWPFWVKIVPDRENRINVDAK
jgi:hypothetical protein